MQVTKCCGELPEYIKGWPICSECGEEAELIDECDFTKNK